MKSLKDIIKIFYSWKKLNFYVFLSFNPLIACSTNVPALKKMLVSEKLKNHSRSCSYLHGKKEFLNIRIIFGILESAF